MEEEVKLALDSVVDDKAPGPDGFPLRFFESVLGGGVGNDIALPFKN